MKFAVTFSTGFHTRRKKIDLKRKRGREGGRVSIEFERRDRERTEDEDHRAVSVGCSRDREEPRIVIFVESRYA